MDVLVEFEPGQVPGFLALHLIEAELSKLLGGRQVDMITKRSLNRRLRDRVLFSAEVEYAYQYSKRNSGQAAKSCNFHLIQPRIAHWARLPAAVHP